MNPFDSTVCATVLAPTAPPGSEANPLFATRLDLFNHEKQVHKDENELWACSCGNKSITRNNFIRHLKASESCHKRPEPPIDNADDDANDDVSLLEAVHAEQRKEVKEEVMEIDLEQEHASSH